MCPHKEIKGNELVDISAKSVSYSGIEVNNLISYKELYNILRQEYKNIDL